MKAIKYYAPPAFGAWEKTAYLFENGFFICEFKYYNKPHYICRKYDFHNPPQKTTWGKDVIDESSIAILPGAINDYQTFIKKEIVEKDFETFKQHILSRNVIFWEVNHHSSQHL